MRPRSSDRGEPRCSSTRSSHPNSFNAATVFGPWRTRLLCKECEGTGNTLQCGHGLRTVENYKYVWGRFSAKILLQCGHGLRTVENSSDGPCGRASSGASMRPRSSDRGEQSLECRERERREGFNAATVFGPWRTPTGGVAMRTNFLLQCGHGLRTVENPGRQPFLARCIPASMRPRSSDRGEPSSWPIRAGSMTRLQCGHGLRTVENLCCLSVVPFPHNASMRPRSSDRGER